MRAAARAAVLAAVVVPLLAFGGTAPWGPALAAMTAALACAAVAATGAGGAHAPLAWTFAGVGVLAALQAVPLPLPLLDLLSPGAARVWRAAPGWESGSLSLAPWHSAGAALLWGAAAALHVAAARVSTKRDLHPWLAGLALAIGLLAIAERILPIALWRERQDPQGLGPFPNRNDLAVLAASAIPLAAASLAAALRAARRPLRVDPALPRVIAWGGAIAVLAAIIGAAGSRVGAAGAAVGAAVFLLARGRGFAPALLLAGALAIGLARGVLPSSQELGGEAGVRLAVWRSALSLFTAHPLAGTGLGSFATAVPLTGHDAGAGFPHHAESDPLELLAEGGLLLLAIVLAAIVPWARGLWREARSGSTSAAGVLGGAAALAAASLGTFAVTGAPALLLWTAVLTAAASRPRERVSRAALLVPLVLLVAAGGRLGGAVYFSSGRGQEPELARRHLLQAIRWDPRHPAALLALAERAAEDAFSSPLPWEDEVDSLDEAANFYLRRLAVRPTDPAARLGLAAVCEALARRSDGNTLRTRAVELRKTAVSMDIGNPAVAPYGRVP